ncbi:MAG: 2Fe-2S iron-sulfur cluster-binding protein [Alphaproteobacteria bacterium]
MPPEDSLSVRVFRFDPGVDDAPRYEVHRVPRTPDMRVLDALNHVYDQSGAPLGYRWYCGTKKCGECALSVNGSPVLSCWEAAADGMTCEPLANFPIVRDLVVDTAPAEARIVQLGLSLSRANPRPFPETLDAGGMEAVNHLSKCIECHVCTAAVPARNLAPEGPALPGGAGPAGLVRFARFALDPREEADRGGAAAHARLDEIGADGALSTVCPQGIDIVREALAPVRERFFGGRKAAAEPSRATAPFFMARAWSAFVRLTDERKSALKADGAIEAIDVPGIAEAYRVG